jgi:hypothetical protein
MKERTLLVVAFLCLAYISPAQKDTCKIGLYINSIYDFRLDEKSFMADFWMWMIYKDDSLRFEDNIEVKNSKTSEFTNFSTEKKATSNWTTQKCKAQIMHQWDVSRFPFDEQRLHIEIEDANHDTSSIVYAVDQSNSKLDQDAIQGEWYVVGYAIKDTIHTYATTYGNPDLAGTSSYPKIITEIALRRTCSWILLAKMLTGAYVAFFISCLVFFLSSANQDSRFGLCVGGLFAAIGNKYIVESMVPTSTTNTLMDNVHNLTFTFILLVVLISIISLNLYESDSPRKIALSKKIDQYSFYTIVSIFAIANAALILYASR